MLSRVQAVRGVTAEEGDPKVWLLSLTMSYFRYLQLP